MANGSGGSGLLSPRSCNHISLRCEDVEKSAKFYKDFLGFDRVDRPNMDFPGVWLRKYGIRIHLLESKDPNNLPKKRSIDPKDNHIAFQCDDINAAKQKLDEKGLHYYSTSLGEGNMRIEQLFFHDPQHYMIELCTCENYGAGAGAVAAAVAAAGAGAVAAAAAAAADAAAAAAAAAAAVAGAGSGSAVVATAPAGSEAAATAPTAPAGSEAEAAATTTAGSEAEAAVTAPVRVETGP